MEKITLWTIRYTFKCDRFDCNQSQNFKHNIIDKINANGNAACLMFKQKENTWQILFKQKQSIKNEIYSR